MKAHKAVAFLNLLFITSSILIFTSCGDDNVTNSDPGDPYIIMVWDYSEDHFFLDTIYKASFVDYFNSTIISQQTSDLTVDEKTFEVWVQTDVTHTGYRKAGLHVDLPVMPSGGYNDSLKTVPSPQQGIRDFGLVRKLEPSEYKLNKYAGYVSLKIDLPENYFAGVAYKRPFIGEQIGIISTDTNVRSTDTLVLKMVKVANLIPQNTLAWELQLRNIYKLPITNVNSDGFEFDVKYLNNGIYKSKLPGISTTLLTITGLDRYTNGRSGGPDNRFDFLPDYTIDREVGWVIFPFLKPFSECLQSYNENGVTIPSEYRYPEIYSGLKSISKTFPNANNYILAGYLR